jgi:hypothetical protein
MTRDLRDRTAVKASGLCSKSNSDSREGTALLAVFPKTGEFLSTVEIEPLVR